MEASKRPLKMSFAYLGIKDIPCDQIKEQCRGHMLVYLDLSNNKIKELRVLSELPDLQTLVLDSNEISSHVKMPLCKELHTLWVNQNRIQNLGLFISTLSKSCPKLRILSMMKNEAAPSFFNGGTYQQYLDYRYFVISSLPRLEVLDYTAVTDHERMEARRIYPQVIVRARKFSHRKRT